jgi:hypothetical protein
MSPKGSPDRGCSGVEAGVKRRNLLQAGGFTGEAGPRVCRLTRGARLRYAVDVRATARFLQVAHVLGDPPPPRLGRLLAVQFKRPLKEGDVRVTTAYNRMLGLPGAWVRDVEFGQDGMIVTVALRRKRPLGSGCGARGLRIKEHRVKRWRHRDSAGCGA